MIALLEKLKINLPFSLLDEASFRRIEETSQIAYYPDHTILIDKDEMPHTLFLIIKGTVEVLSDEELIDIYHSNDMFGGIELMKKQPSYYQYVVTEELICYEVSENIFVELCEKNREFKAYFLSSVVDRIDILKEKKEYSFMGDLMVERMKTSLLHKGCVISADTSIMQALKRMDESKSTSIIVKNDEGYGIVTDADFRYYILHKEEEDLQLISQIQTYPAISIQEGELLFNILVLMTKHSIKHLPVFDHDNTLLGLLELIDLLSYFSNQSHLIMVQMSKAQTVENLVDAAKRLAAMIAALHAKGVKSRYIAKLVSEINRKMYVKLFEMIVPASWHEKCALILLGSEGRSEQILRTDQDNALIFEEGFMPDDKEHVTTAFIKVLDEIGFPRCEGNVMIINDKWCKSIEKYKHDIDQWIEHPSYDGLMDMAIFFDSMVIAGNKTLHTKLLKYLTGKVLDNQNILIHFAKPIQTFESPLGIFSQFVSDNKAHKHEIDIKKGALFALVHGVRALALEYGISATNTTLRIKELNNIGFFSKEDARDMVESLEVINTLRLHAQLDQLAKGKTVNNYIPIANIGKIERDLLKEALKIVNKFKKMVSYHFHLSAVS